MKILLTTLNAKYIHLNLAIRLLYDLNKEHPNLDWHEFTIKENKDEIADYCADYDLIAFSCYIWNISQTLVVCEKIKERNQLCDTWQKITETVEILISYFYAVKTSTITIHI